MGLLSEGKPLSWAETKKNAGLVKRVGIQQFLALYHKVKNRKDDLKWGDEVCCLKQVMRPLQWCRLDKTLYKTKPLIVLYRNHNIVLLLYKHPLA